MGEIRRRRRRRKRKSRGKGQSQKKNTVVFKQTRAARTLGTLSLSRSLSLYKGDRKTLQL